MLKRGATDMKCLNCETDVVSKGTKPAKYCSDACRKAYKRTQDKKRTEQTDSFQKALTEVVSDKIENASAIANPLEPLELMRGKPANFGKVDCDCGLCKSNRATGSRKKINHGPWKDVTELEQDELNRVTIPGDVDYRGVAHA